MPNPKNFIKGDTMKKFTLTILIVLALIVVYCKKFNIVNELKNDNNLELFCLFKNGYRKIPKNKILTFDDSNNVWIFTNGYARSCRIEKIDN